MKSYDSTGALDPGIIMTIYLRVFGILFFVGSALLAVAPALAGDGRIALCHGGLITLQPFDKHINQLRMTTRYSKEDIETLISRNKKGGADFFSSQIVVQKAISGSGTYDLRLFHGISNAAKYRNVTPWACEGEDYPIVYFVGFRVRQIDNNTISVTREKDIVNVISLKILDQTLTKHLSVKLFDHEVILCADIATTCGKGIFYDNED